MVAHKRRFRCLTVLYPSLQTIKNVLRQALILAARTQQDVVQRADHLRQTLGAGLQDLKDLKSS